MKSLHVVGWSLAAAIAVASPSRAQDTLTGMVISGPSERGSQHSTLVTGRQVKSPPSSSTEIALSDGTSIVLGPGADITVDSVQRNRESGHWVLTGRSDRGSLRVLAADQMEVVLRTTSGELHLARTSAVVQSGPNGSATLLSGGEVELRHDGRTDQLRRPGFRLVLANGAVERALTPQLVTAVDQFAPVARPAASVGRPPQQISCTPEENQKSARHGASPSVAPCFDSKAAYVPSQNQTVTYNSNQATGSRDQAFALAHAELSQTGSGTSNFTAPGSNSITASPAQDLSIIAPENGALPNVVTGILFSDRTRVGTASLNHDGFATGIVRSAAADQTSFYAVSSSQLGDAHIETNPGNTEFIATLGFQPTAVGSLSADKSAAPAPNGASGRKAINFVTAPGPIPTTAVISTETFAGSGLSGVMASVDSDTVRGIANRTGSIVAPGGATVDASLPPSNEHLVWGIFLGNLSVEPMRQQQRDSIGLGFWVAGRPMSLQALQAVTGTATYAGGMIGTIIQQPGAEAQLKTVIGQFAEEWNFGNHSGSMNTSFDGGTWSRVGVTMPVGQSVFGGAGVSDNGRIMTVQGAFFNNKPVVQMPATVGGLFGVRGAGYGANGIFVGGRR